MKGLILILVTAALAIAYLVCEGCGKNLAGHICLGVALLILFLATISKESV